MLSIPMTPMTAISNDNVGNDIKNRYQDYR